MVFGELEVKAPFCFVTTGDPEIISELQQCIASFRKHNSGIPILVVGYGLEADCKRLGVHWRDYDKDFQFATSHGRKRCMALREGLAHGDWALYADADVLFTGKIDSAEFQGDVMLSRHYISADMESKYGKFNSGYVATNSEKFTKFWPEFTDSHPELFFEQQPLEYMVGHFQCHEFSERHNLGWWQYDHNPQRYMQLLSRDPISIHGHLKQLGQLKAGITANWRPEWAAMMNEWLAKKQPKRIVVYVLEYHQSDAQHQAEIDECFKRNHENPIADKIVVMSDSKRQNFNDVFDLARTEPAGTFCCVCNSDCFWDATLARVKDLDLKHKILAITRITCQGNIEDSALGCQDGWIWLAEHSPSNWEPLEFGRGGVDNRLIYVAHNAGYSVENRCDLIRLQHLHANNPCNSSGRFPTYPHPHGYIQPGLSQSVFIAHKYGEFPGQQKVPRYPQMVQVRHPRTGQIGIGIIDARIKPASKACT